MIDLGDRRAGVTLRFPFNTNAIAGESITVGTNGTMKVYKDGNTSTETTTGATFSEDVDGITGVHLAVIDTSADGAFYSEGSDFLVMFQGATIDGKAINAWVGSFSLANRAGLMPTTANRKLDVSAGGEAGVDWANVGSPTTTNNLSGTTIKTATDVEADTADIQTRIPAALVSGRIDSSTGAMAANVLTASALASDAVTEIQSGLATQASVDTIDGFLDTEVAAIKAKTDNLPSDPADQSLIIAATDAIVSAISGLNDLNATETAAAVWNALLATYNAAGSFGAFVQAITGGGGGESCDPEEIAALVIAAIAESGASDDHIREVIFTTVPASYAVGNNFAALVIAASATLTAEQMKAQVAAYFGTDSAAEPSGVPAANAPLATKISYTYRNARNKRTETATQQRTYMDDSTTVAETASVGFDGTTLTVNKGT